MFERPLRGGYRTRGKPGNHEILASRSCGNDASEQALAMATSPGARRDQFEYRF